MAKKKNKVVGNIHCFVELYLDPNLDRMKEYVYCINKNISNPSIKRIYLVCYQEDYNNSVISYKEKVFNQLTDLTKIEVVLNSKQRLSFGDLSNMVVSYVPEGEIVLVSNLDVFVPDIQAWRDVDREFFSIAGNRACLALCRTEFINEALQYREELGWQNGEFADCWVFRAPLNFKPEDFPFDVAVGNAPQCDNFMFGFLARKYERVFNWSEKYITYHFDLVRKPTKIVDRYNIMILNDKTGTVPITEYHATLSPYQDWQTIFNETFTKNEE